MKSILNIALCLLLATGTMLFFQQCLMEDEPTYWLPDAPVLGVTNVHGTVVDHNRMPLAGVEVKDIHNGIAITNEFGYFEMEKAVIVRGRLLLTANAPGFFDKTHATLTDKEHTTLQIMMSQKNVQTVSATAPSVIDMETASVQLPPNGFASTNGTPYTGNVEVNFAHYHPTNDYFELLMPGGDFEGVSANNEEVLLLSYGAMSVELFDEMGNELQLAEGQTATLQFLIPDEMLADAPATIPLWYYDEEIGKWQEEGFATKDGMHYIGTVSHFSDWNIDLPLSDRTWLEGQVVDCNGMALADIAVKVGPLIVYTNENGVFGTNVAAGFDFTVEVPDEYNLGLDSEVVNVSGINENESVDLGTINTQCASYLSGYITNCDSTPVGGSVLVSWDTGVKITYTDDGSYTILVPSNKDVTLNAYALIEEASYVASLETTTSTEELITLAPIPLCEPFLGSVSECPSVSFLADSAPFIFDEENLTYEFSNYIDAFVGEYAGGLRSLNITDGNYTLSLVIPNETPDLYPIVGPDLVPYVNEDDEIWCGVGSATLIMATSLYLSVDGQTIYAGDGGTIQLIQNGPDYIAGTFSATCNASFWSNIEYDYFYYITDFGIMSIDFSELTEGSFCIPIE